MKSEKAKVLHPVLGQPLCAYPMGRALALGCDRGGGGGRAPGRTQVQRRPGGPLPGRGRSASRRRRSSGARRTRSGPRTAALEGFEGPVLMLYGDTPLLRESRSAPWSTPSAAATAPLALVSTVTHDPAGYGRVLRGSGSLTGIVEQKDCTAEQRAIREVNAGIYVVDAASSGGPGRAQARQTPRASTTSPTWSRWPRSGATWRSVSADFEETAGRERPRRAGRAAPACSRIASTLEHMRGRGDHAGPRRAPTVEAEVSIGPDTTLGPIVSLRGRPAIGSEVTIGQGCVLTATDGGRRDHGQAVLGVRGRAGGRPGASSARSRGCGRAPSWPRACTWATSWRRRRPASARAPRPTTSPTWATRRSARA